MLIFILFIIIQFFHLKLALLDVKNYYVYNGKRRNVNYAKNERKMKDKFE